MRSSVPSGVSVPVTSTSHMGRRRCNLTALPIRLVTIWRMRPTSPTWCSGRPGLETHDHLQVLLLGAGRHQRGDVLHRFGQVEGRRIGSTIWPAVDLGEVENVVDDGQQRGAPTS